MGKTVVVWNYNRMYYLFKFAEPISEDSGPTEETSRFCRTLLVWTGGAEWKDKWLSVLEKAEIWWDLGCERYMKCACTSIAFMLVILPATLHVPRHGDAGQVSGGTNNPCRGELCKVSTWLLPWYFRFRLFSPVFLLDSGPAWSFIQIYAGFMDSWSLCCFAPSLFAGQAPGIRIIRRTA